jgi:hypothetical protein
MITDLVSKGEKLSLTRSYKQNQINKKKLVHHEEFMQRKLQINK